MSSKFHISEDGQPAKCAAKIKCRLGGDTGTEDHFDTPGEAREAYEKKMSDHTLPNSAKFEPNSKDLKDTAEDLDNVAKSLEDKAEETRKSKDYSQGHPGSLDRAAKIIRENTLGMDFDDKNKTVNSFAQIREDLLDEATSSWKDADVAAYLAASKVVEDVTIKYDDGEEEIDDWGL